MPPTERKKEKEKVRGARREEKKDGGREGGRLEGYPMTYALSLCINQNGPIWEDEKNSFSVTG